MRRPGELPNSLRSFTVRPEHTLAKSPNQARFVAAFHLWPRADHGRQTHPTAKIRQVPETRGEPGMRLRQARQLANQKGPASQSQAGVRTSFSSSRRSATRSRCCQRTSGRSQSRRSTRRFTARFAGRVRVGILGCGEAAQFHRDIRDGNSEWLAIRRPLARPGGVPVPGEQRSIQARSCAHPESSRP